VCLGDTYVLINKFRIRLSCGMPGHTLQTNILLIQLGYYS
ncbi:unnamed protein product, partial [Rotaria socialis]